MADVQEKDIVVSELQATKTLTQDVREQVVQGKQYLINEFQKFIQETAQIFGFPENPGMVTHTSLNDTDRYYFSWNMPRLNRHLPIHEVPFPPEGIARSYGDVVFGPPPRPDIVERVFYESKGEGYYNFYVQNFKNLVFLPNEVSEFLQIKCNFCLDISLLEVCRETLFALLILYYYIIQIRILLAWLISINPYTFPIVYFIALVDWIEDISYGLLPVIAGVSLATPVLMAAVGKGADLLNHLVFTMPFLPSEGVPGLAYINGKLTDVLYFRYLPALWYTHPIPNDLKEYWYTERPEILKFLQGAYVNLKINFLPDRIVELQQKNHLLEAVNSGMIFLLHELTSFNIDIEPLVNNFFWRL